MTKFGGGRSPFGSNDGTSMAAPKTKFGGRPAVPPGQLQRYPGAVADIAGSNRRAAKNAHGTGGGSGTTFKTHTAFGGGSRKGR